MSASGILADSAIISQTQAEFAGGETEKGSPNGSAYKRRDGFYKEYQRAAGKAEERRQSYHV